MVPHGIDVMGGYWFIAALIVCVSAAIAATMTRWLARPSSIFYALDHPNQRSLHTTPTPRTGGLAILLAVLLVGGAVALAFGTEWQWVVGIGVAVSIVAVTSLIDDRRSLSAGLRLVLHIAGACVLAGVGLTVDGSWVPGEPQALPAIAAVVITVFASVWMLELYNFMDGMDGLAGGMAVIGFGGLAALAALGRQPLLTLEALTVAGAAFGFLLHNFPPARIFMGDVGSATLGLLAAGLSLWGAHTGAFPLWAAVLVFSPFIVDATVTLLRRIYRQEKVWEAHRSHYYQRLAGLGWPHRRIVLTEYALMVAASLTALWAVGQPTAVQWTALAGWVALYAMLAISVDRLDVAHRAAVRELATR